MAENKQFQIAQMVKDIRENIPALIEHARLNAKIIRAKYEALLEVGFTESQAIELCRKD